MELVQITISVPKEMNDIRNVISQLSADITAKKDISMILAGILPLAMEAINGYQGLGDEAKLAEAYVLYGLIAGELAKALFYKPPEVIAAPVA